MTGSSVVNKHADNNESWAPSVAGEEGYELKVHDVAKLDGENATEIPSYVRKDVTEGGQLSKRADWNWSVNGHAENAGARIAWAAGLISLRDYIADKLWSVLRKRECAVLPIYHITQRGSGDTIYYRGKATGRNCDTMAKKDTITRIMKKWLNEEWNGRVCAYHCFRSDHGGTSDYFLSVGTNLDLVQFGRCDETSGPYDCKNEP